MPCGDGKLTEFQMMRLPSCIPEGYLIVTQTVGLYSQQTRWRYWPSSLLTLYSPPVYSSIVFLRTALLRGTPPRLLGRLMRKEDMMKRERRKGDRKRRKKRRKKSISHRPPPLCCQISRNLNGVHNGVGCGLLTQGDSVGKGTDSGRPVWWPPSMQDSDQVPNHQTTGSPCGKHPDGDQLRGLANTVKVTFVQQVHCYTNLFIQNRCLFGIPGEECC